MSIASQGSHGTTYATSDIQLVDITHSPVTKIFCSSGTAAGQAYLGTHTPPDDIAADLTASSWTACKWPLNLPLAFTHVGAWHLHVVSRAGGTVSTGYLDNVTINVASSPRTSCSFTMAGAIDATFDSATQVLTVAPVTGSGHQLTLSNVTGCAGQNVNGDKMTINAKYLFTMHTGFAPLNIS